MKWLTLVAAVGLVFGLAGCGETQKAKGPGKKELKITGPSNTTLKQGEKKDVTVDIKRTGFDGPVTVTISDLPKGVTSDENSRTVEKGGNSVKFTLTAADDAAPVDDHEAKVTAKSSEVNDAPFANFKVTVKKK